MSNSNTPGAPGFQRLAVVTTVTTLLLVALGGLVRATDNGLACPDWPYCYGALIPTAADLPPGASLLGAWTEHTHRLVASIVGFQVLALAVWALLRQRHRRGVVVAALVALVLVGVQAWIGRQVVLGLLAAHLVTLHLGMAMLVLACLVYLTVSVAVPRRDGGDRALARLSGGVAALAYVQLLVGATVTGLGAGLVFDDFPLMDGALLPPIGSEAAALHVAHRYLAYALVVATGALWIVARRRAHGWLQRLPLVAFGLVLVQAVLGVANLVGELHPVTVVPHLAVASWIWTVLVLQTLLAARLPVTSPPSRTAVAAAVGAR